MWCGIREFADLMGKRGKHKDFFLAKASVCAFPSCRGKKKSVHELHHCQVQDMCQNQHLNITLN